MAVKNYVSEARLITIGLTINQKYELYEIVKNQLQKHSSDDRIKELKAVQKVLEQDKNLDKRRLQKIILGEVGMTSEISQHDLISNKKINRKKN